MAILPIEVKESGITQTNRKIKELDKSADKLTSTFSGVTAGAMRLAGGIAALVGIGQLTRSFIQNADAMTNMNSQLKLVTKSTSELLQVQNQLFNISQSSRTSLQGTTELYAKIARNTKDLNVSNKELLKVTETISKAMTISGGSAESMNAAIVQLSQGFASGTLRGEELNSVMEQTPRLAEAIAEGMGKSLGELRALGAEGKLTAQAVMEALKSQAETIDTEFKNVGTTVSQSMTQVSNSTLMLVGDMDKAFGVTNQLSSSLTELSKVLIDNKDDIIDIGQDIIAGATIVANGLESIYLVSKTGYMKLGIAFKSEIEAVLNAIIEAFESSLNYITKEINQSTDYWNKALGLDIGTISEVSLGRVTIDTNDLSKSIEDANSRIQELGRSTDAAFVEIATSAEKVVAAVDMVSKKTSEIKTTSLLGTKEDRELAIEQSQQLADLIIKALDYIKSDTDKINEKNLEMYNVMQSIWDDTEMQKFFKKWQKEIDDVTKKSDKYEGIGSKDWTAGLKGSYKDLANIGNAFQDLGKEQKDWNKFSKENVATEEDKNKHLSNQLQTYGNIAGAIGSMYEEGSEGAKAAQIAQATLAVVEGGLAVIHQMTAGDPYTAIPRAIAVAAVVAQALGSAGIGGGTSNSYDVGAAQVANTGTGTVLGDTSKQSESISNSLSIIEDYAKPQYQVLQDMNKSLSYIASNIGGLAAQIIQTGGAMTGQGFSVDTSGIGKNSIATVGSIIDKGLSEIPIVSYVGHWVGSILGGLGGAVSSIMGGGTKTSLADYGISFNEQLATSAIEAINGSAFQTIKKHTDGGWFSSSSNSYSTVLSQLDSQVQKDFTSIINGLYDTIVNVGSAFDISVSEVEKSLSQTTINLGKISFSGKTGEEIQKNLESVFSAEGDKLAKAAFPILDVYQKVGEAFFETMTRVATDVQVVTKTFELFSNSIIDNKIAISESFVTIAGSLSNFADLTSNYYDAYFTETEQYANTLNMLDENFASLNITTPKTYEEFRNIVESLDITALAGQEAFIQIMQLADSFTTIADMAKNSMNNIKEFADSFKTQEELAIEMAKSLGVNVAASNNELFSLFDTLKGGVDGLTDAELELLNANKYLIESNKDLIESNKELEKSRLEEYLNSVTQNISTLETSLTSLDSVLNKFGEVFGGTDYSLNKFYDSMENTQALLASGDFNEYNKSLAETISASDILFNPKAFTSAEEMLLAQSRAANQFDNLEVKTVTQIDLLQEIADNTQAQVDAINGMAGDLIGNAYQTALGRTPDAAGADYWNNQLASGAVSASNLTGTIAKAAVDYTGGAVAGVDITASKQNAADYLVKDIYSKYGLDQYQTDNSGYDYWENQVLSGVLAPENLNEAIRVSAEQVLGTSIIPKFDGGGFTGNGLGMIDSTGQEIAGVVHNKEWVAPSWMIDNNQNLFNQLENARKRGSYANGGFTSDTIIQGSNKEVSDFQESMIKLEKMFREVTENGSTMNVRLVG
jgi:tape measure domain-containing protein